MIGQIILDIRSTKKDFRNFGITVGFIILIIGGFLFWKNKTSYLYFIMVSIILLGSGLAVPIILKPIYLVWMVFSAVLGWIMTSVILSILFYLIFTPIGLISRLFGKQFIELKWDKSLGSYWNYRDTKQLEKEDYEKQF